MTKDEAPRYAIVFGLIVAAGLVAMGYFANRQLVRTGNKVMHATLQLSVLRTAVENFESDTGRRITKASDFADLTKPIGRGPYVVGGVSALLDPWNRPFVFDTEQRSITCLGSDGAPGGMSDAGDIILYLSKTTTKPAAASGPATDQNVP